MIHPRTELKKISDIVGYGVVATEFIPAGTITWALDKFDRTFSPKMVQEMEPVYQNIMDIYSYRDSKGNFVLCWDYGRFVNHSFKSNCLSTAYNFEIAICDIYPGEQLTDDYGYLNVSEPFEPIDEGTERKIVFPDDLVNFHKMWDKQLLNVFGQINTLNQPLMHLIPKEVRDEIIAVNQGKKPMESILSNYYSEKEVVSNS